mmetsp:Transcript_50079/g.98004  ORF Transcript_50079/g.98004 Transcript_50079/m.98004 type:complete len:326 (+) Transcript_50079:862-1839(+)
MPAPLRYVEQHPPQQIQPLSGDRTSLNDGRKLMHLLHNSIHICVSPHRERSPSNVRSPQHLTYFLPRGVQGVFWTSVNFREDDNGRNAEGAAQVEVVLRHVRRRVARIHEYEGVVCETARDSVDGRLEVPLMSRQIHKRHHSIRLTRHLILRTTAVCAHPVPSADRGSIAPKAHQMSGASTRAAALNFVSVFHDRGAALSPAVVEAARGEGADEGGLAGVDVSDHRHAGVAGGERLADRMAGGVVVFYFDVFVFVREGGDQVRLDPPNDHLAPRRDFGAGRGARRGGVGRQTSSSPVRLGALHELFADQDGIERTSKCFDTIYGG